ncbi:MAG: hypothetical protein GXO23_07380 [Crenarchaeota archaeon]|nr:hypothetical protein [Thermoproteota archaeon]
MTSLYRVQSSYRSAVQGARYKYRLYVSILILFVIVSITLLIIHYLYRYIYRLTVRILSFMYSIKDIAVLSMGHFSILLIAKNGAAATIVITPECLAIFAITTLGIFTLFTPVKRRFIPLKIVISILVIALIYLVDLLRIYILGLVYLYLGRTAYIIAHDWLLGMMVLIAAIVVWALWIRYAFQRSSPR